MKKILIPLILCGIILAGLLYYYFLTPFSCSDKNEVVYIDDDDDIDSVYNKLSPIGSEKGITGLNTLIRHSKYPEHIKMGRYEISKKESPYNVFKKLKNGLQTPVMVTVPSCRTMDQLAAKIGAKLLIDSAEIYDALTDSAICASYGYNKATIPCMFIPNTYDIYWNTSLETFLNRMKKEVDRYWNDERMAKAKEMGLTPVQVCTIASIVDEETANDAEKPTIAGLYYNRYKIGMKLQADPTVKYAIGDFAIKRVLNWMLTKDSPYNTYMHEGLPPGPIRIPTLQAIEAVLNYQHHDYLYMCAKEDFSGTHNFARTQAEHNANAQRYYKALNERGIR